MSDTIGAMRARVRLQSPVRMPDELGGAAVSWVDQGEVWAAITSSAAGEAPAFDAVPAPTSHRLTINRFDGVRTGWRVVWGQRVLRIVTVVDAGEPRITLICEEEIR